MHHAQPVIDKLFGKGERLSTFTIACSYTLTPFLGPLLFLTTIIILVILHCCLRRFTCIERYVRQIKHTC